MTSKYIVQRLNGKVSIVTAAVNGDLDLGFCHEFVTGNGTRTRVMYATLQSDFPIKRLWITRTLFVELHDQDKADFVQSRIYVKETPETRVIWKIGLAIAKRLGQEGSHIVISSRNEENVNKAVKQLIYSGLKPENIHGCVCHVGNAAHRERLVNTTLEKFGQIDILVNNAGINPTAGDIMETSEEAWDKLFDVNVKAGFLLTKLVVPHMHKNGGGNVVFNSSVTVYNCPPMIAAYGVTKTALLGLTKAMAESLASKNIRVNCIAPGIIKTKYSKSLWEDVKVTEIHQHQSAYLQPSLDRFGTPKECAGVVAFLCSNDASYVTGESIVIGGGVHARL